jgi:hypothetical protein
MKKLLLGMALVALLCMVGAAGYRFGQHLAQCEGAQATAQADA